MQLTIPFAVEKVLFRLALREGGTVPIARAFLELPCSLEELEAAADGFADGVSVVKNEWSEFLTYEFPELQRATGAAAPDDCPTCGGACPPAPTEAGVPVRAPLLCDACHRGVRVSRSKPDPGFLDKVKKLVKQDEEQEDPARVAKLEHEIFFLGLSLGVDQITHTMLAAQSRNPSTELKARLDKMAARRYIHVGLLPSGDAVGYRFPPGLKYPRVLWQRIADPSGGTAKVGAIDLEERRRAAAIHAPPPPPPKPQIKIVVTPKDRRRPGGR